MTDPDLEQLLTGALQRFNLIRIDAGLEGVWSETVRPIYTPKDGWLGAPIDDLAHERFKPCIEVYFAGLWLGLPTFVRRGGINRLDEVRVRAIADLVARHSSERD